MRCPLSRCSAEYGSGAGPKRPRLLGLARDLAVRSAELGYWLTKAGQDVQPDGDHPYALLAAGRWREAAAAWEAMGCSYEHEAALAESIPRRPLDETRVNPAGLTTRQVDVLRLPGKGGTNA